MKKLWYAAPIFLLAGMAAAQIGAAAGTGTINSMSGSTNQNQALTGTTGHSIPPAPVSDGGEPSAEDRVSGTPANATTMHLESETTPAAQLNTSVPGGGEVAQEAVFESAKQSSGRAGK